MRLLMKFRQTFVRGTRRNRVLKKIIFFLMTLAVLALLTVLVMLILYRDSFQYPLQWKRKIYKPFSEGIRPDSINLEFYHLNSSLNQGNLFDCVKTQTVPSVSVCLYPVDRDNYISHDIRHAGTWEPYITALVLEVLGADPTSVFLDVGSNVGYYTLLAAKAGHLVVSIEPDKDHVLRLHRGIELEGLEGRIVVLRNAVADRRATVTVRKSGNNQGDSRIEMELKECQGSCPPTVKSIALNDLTHLIYDLTIISTNQDEGSPGRTLYEKLDNFRKERDVLMSLRSNPSDVLGFYKKTPSNVILKLDTQGFEHLIFDNPDFFFDRNAVTHIFMEWGMMARSHTLFNKTMELPQDKTFFGQKDLGPEDAVKVEIMIRFLSERKFRPYSAGLPRLYEALNPSTWHLWPHDVVWIHDNQWLFMVKMGLKKVVG